MFNFFKKKSETQPLNNAFLDSFSKEEKGAMIYTLMLMVASDGYTGLS